MKANINTAFCRGLLAEQRKELTAEQKRALKGAWVYKTGRSEWEFHCGDFYWYGNAANASDARFNGTNAWLNKFYPEQN